MNSVKRAKYRWHDSDRPRSSASSAFGVAKPASFRAPPDIFKREVIGIYQHCSSAHLKRYLAEFDFRYNQRVALGVSDPARMEVALRGILGKTYRDSSPARQGG